MRNYLLAAAAVAAIVTPAMARDGAGYVGIEGGIIAPRKTPYNVTATTTPATTTTSYDSAFVSRYKKGADLDAIAGYDFGLIRLEGELGYKRTKVKSIALDNALATAIGEVPGTRYSPADLGLTNKTTVLSAMANALVDVDVAPGTSLYAGGGAGYARVKTFGDRDNAFAWQLIAGARTAVSENVDLGLKYRYFQTAKLKSSADNLDGLGTNLATDGKFKSHSLLASLIFNFGGAEAAPPPPPPVEVAPPPPPPPAPPATQTCPDGSVIDAMATCPPPPPPPPPAPPAQGERG